MWKLRNFLPTIFFFSKIPWNHFFAKEKTLNWFDEKKFHGGSEFLVFPHCTVWWFQNFSLTIFSVSLKIFRQINAQINAIEIYLSKIGKNSFGKLKFVIFRAKMRRNELNEILSTWIRLKNLHWNVLAASCCLWCTSHAT